MKKKLSFPLFLPFKERTYSIQGYIQDTENFVDNKGYIDSTTGIVYICSKNNPPVHKDVPIIYVTEHDGNKKELGLEEVENEQTMSVFKETSLYSLSMDTIIENTTGNEVLYNEEALADMNAATSVFVPVINETDDPLKKIIKQTIISKQIDINRLKCIMPKKYGLTNMKSALVGKTKMSIPNFNIWCELLGVDYEIHIKDNGSDHHNPLYEDLHYYSKSNRLVEVLDSEK